MANEEHFALLRQGHSGWNEWRIQHPWILPDFKAKIREGQLNRIVNYDLDQCNLSGVDLSYADLSNTNLGEADLSNADLSYANLSYSNLNKTNLNKANLYSANLSYTNLQGSVLSDVNLFAADLSGAALSGSDLSNAVIGFTTLACVDLSAVKGLITVKHLGPSSIGIDTIYRSKGKIPDIFLRAAGVSREFLECIHSQADQTIKYFTCFISHSRKDQEFCDCLYADLCSHDVQSWYFPEDATWGKSVWGEIDRGIKDYDKLVVVCSEHSLQSGPVLREIERALQREDRESKHVLFPLRLDDYLLEQWEHDRKDDLLSKVVGDFRGWNSSAAKYDAAFKKFLKALKAQE
jgi:TIR domain/Pentapeptide repeats (8 copies)